MLIKFCAGLAAPLVATSLTVSDVSPVADRQAQVSACVRADCPVPLLEQSHGSFVSMPATFFDDIIHDSVLLKTPTDVTSVVKDIKAPPQLHRFSGEGDSSTSTMFNRCLFLVQAGVEDKIEMRFGQAVEFLDALLSEGQAGTFDFVFIEADKENCDKYYERSLQLHRKNGLIAIDNVLWRGLVYDPSDKSTEVAALREFNKKLHEDERIDVCLLPLRDGITIAWKR
ncbi:catechol O-methyltransferase domain-containing protein 1-like isoform X2 [Rhipicephalus microplus]|uniref:catechol O-methyltransferase domain-containing protein 1-like isoform X2 n=1 Tax=Rhipicephalus microplus TaxID=6941 RepID=UPI003F6C284A